MMPSPDVEVRSLLSKNVRKDTQMNDELHDEWFQAG